MANRETEVDNLIINELTKAEFDSADKSETELYFVTDDKVQISEVEGLETSLNSKQDTLVSGTNIKTINGESIVGTGDLKLSSYHPPILSCMWSDHLINDIQWLRADTFSWQSGDVYTTAYNHLASDYSEAVPVETDTINGITIYYKRSADGHKVCHHNQEQNALDIYNSTGIAWYYILDTENKRFKLPRSKYSRFTQNKVLPVVGNGYGVGLTDGTNDFLLRNSSVSTSNKGLSSSNLVFPQQVGVATNASFASQDKIVGITTDPTKSGIQTIYSDTTDENMHLYFYVGEFSREAIEQTAGLNAEMFNSKADVSYVNTGLGKKLDVSTFNSKHLRYETDWFTVDVKGLYTFDISTQDVFTKLHQNGKFINIYLVYRVDTASGDFGVGDIVYSQYANYIGSTGSQASDVGICIKPTGILQVRQGNSTNVVVNNSNGYGNLAIASCSLKIILEGWDI